MLKKKTQKRSKLAPALLLAGVAGGVAAALRKRGGKAGEQLQQAATQAADAASQVADRAKEAAPEQVSDAIESVQEKVGGESSEGTDATAPADEGTRRYAAPAEAGSQPPAQGDNAPSDATVVRDTPSGLSEDLHTKPHDLPADVVMPDTSDDDPAVRDAEAAAAADAGSIGGNTDDKQA
jgi:hypothetical protein